MTLPAKFLAAAALLATVTLSVPAQRGAGARTVTPANLALSPDGTTVAFTLRGREGAAIHLIDVTNPDPAKEKLVTAGSATSCAYTSPLWSPDSQTLAFLSTCTSKAEKSDQEEIFLWSKSTAETHQLTHLTGNLQHLAWSPDGKSIAFLFVENATRSAGALDAMKPWAGVIGEDGVEIQRVAAVAADGSSAQPTFLTPATLHVYEFAWSPAAPEIAFIAAPPPGENTWWIAKLYTRAHGADVKTVLDPTTVPGLLHGLQIAVPKFSPDGKQIAFIGGLMSDQGSTGGDVWVIPSTGGEPMDVTPGIDGTPVFEEWFNNRHISFVEDRRGHTVLADYDLATRAYVEGSAIDLGETTVSGGPIKGAISSGKGSSGFVTAFVRSGPIMPSEVWIVGSDDKLRQLTHLNADAKPSGPKFESIEWENEGFHVQGWLTYPKEYDPAKKYPLLVEVHGGPSASAGPRPSTTWSDLGYFVFAPNPRGSFGQGETFVQANIKDFGYGDLRDIEKGMDSIEARLPIDKTREGLTGWSYGGFMTMFGVTQTHRFRAAVAGAGISDWQSYYGENSIDQWMVPFFGATVYDDPVIYAKSSAINYIKNITTPTLVIVGDRDGECPAPQSFEFWHALRAEGVKTQLVVYPNEGHGFRDPEHIRDRAEREAKWFAQNMPAKQ